MAMGEATAKAAVEALRWNGIEPIKTFIGPAGSDVTVEAWEVEAGEYVIRCRCGKTTDYAETREVNNLESWASEYLPEQDGAEPASELAANL